MIRTNEKGNLEIKGNMFELFKDISFIIGETYLGLKSEDEGIAMIFRKAMVNNIEDLFKLADDEEKAKEEIDNNLEDDFEKLQKAFEEKILNNK